jgi:two-component system, NarL family, sensor histidine kinase UhpB
MARSGDLGPGKTPRFSLVDRALLSSTALLVLIFVLLAVTPVTVSAPIRVSELAILGGALVAMLVLNVIRVRRTLAPLRSLSAEMASVDLRHPERARIGGSSETRELAAFTDAFNEMLDRLADERRAGARAALIAQERERGRIARALHDEAGQTLTAVALEVERAASQGPEADRERMAAVAQELHSTLDEIRRITRELRPEALDDLGLVNALIALSSRASRSGRVRVERRLDSDLPRMSEELELVVYRVAQEALTNVLRHAEASRCLLELTSSGGAITLTVSDDGKGMPASYDGTIGIEGMRERALLVGGTLSIESRPGAGTTVMLRVPVEAG